MIVYIDGQETVVCDSCHRRGPKTGAAPQLGWKFLTVRWPHGTTTFQHLCPPCEEDVEFDIPPSAA